MPRKYIEHRTWRLLGNEKRAEQLIDWSCSHRVGQRWIKDFPFGLRLGFVADNDQPKMYLHWNQQQFEQFYHNLGCSPKVLFLSEYGICVSYSKGRTKVVLPGSKGTSISLWDSKTKFCQEQKDASVYWMIGMIRFSSEPLFYDQVETQQELEEASAVASIRVPKKEKTTVKTVAQALPKQEPLTMKARAYLFQDALTSLLLKKQNNEKAG